jgi:predicted permease
MQLWWAVRHVLRRPTRAVVCSLALGLGIATAVIGVELVRGILLRPLPFPNADRLVRLIEVDEGGRRWWPSYPNIVDWRTYGSNIFDAVGASEVPAPKPVIWDGQAQQLSVSSFTRGLVEALEVQPAVGRSFTAGENAPGGPPVALLSWGFWQSALGGAPIDELSFTIGTELFSVVGVLPPEFRFFGEMAAWSSADMYLPMERSSNLGPRGSHGYHTVARLRVDLPLARAQQEMATLARDIRETHGEPTQAHTVSLTPVREEVLSGVRPALQLLLATAGMLLLVACLNVGGTLLADGLRRDRELAIRMALGARRGHLHMQLLLEALTLAVPGALIAVVLTGVTVRMLRSASIRTLPRLDELSVDVGTLLIACAVALLAAMLAGIVPALLLSARDVGNRLRGSMGLTAARSNQRIWRGFIIGQTALTMVLLFGSALLGRSLFQALNVPLGYQPEDVVAFGITLPESRYADGARRIPFYERVLEEVRGSAGVQAVGLTSFLPNDMGSYTSGTGKKQDELEVHAAYRLVDSGFFEAIRLSAPSDLTIVGSQAWIDAALVSRLFGDDPALGARIYNGYHPDFVTVAGVVGSIREWQMLEPVPAVYVDFRTRPDAIARMQLLVRSERPAPEIASEVRRIVNAIDPLVPLTSDALESHITRSMANRALIFGIIAVFAIVGLCLAAVAVYALVTFAVQSRRREVAIRMSLGAAPLQVHTVIARYGLLPALTGVLAGLALTFPAGTFLRAQLFNVKPHDGVALGAATVLLLITSMIAAAVPAHAASRTDPARVLRED